MNKLIALFAMFILYNFLSVFMLYKSDYLNVISYYTHPPLGGKWELERLPMLFGDYISLRIAKVRRDDAVDLIYHNKIRLSSVLASYDNEQFLEKYEARKRAFLVAELFILNGYDPNMCEIDDISTASILDKWGVLDNENIAFLNSYTSKDNIFICNIKI